jgi:hypothetical protein
MADSDIWLQYMLYRRDFPPCAGWAGNDASVTMWGLQVADAPKVLRTQRMQTLYDLESPGLQHLKHFLTEQVGSEIDLSLLLSCLVPEEQLEEASEHWDDELLLTKVVTDMERGGDSAP